jgi:hypothetical protein
MANCESPALFSAGSIILNVPLALLKLLSLGWLVVDR